MIINSVSNFFDKQTSPMVKEIILPGEEAMIALEVIGSGTFSLSISGKMNADSEFSTISAIDLSDYSVTNNITKKGLFSIGAVGLSSVQLNLTSVSGEVTVSYRTSN